MNSGNRARFARRCIVFAGFLSLSGQLLANDEIATEQAFLEDFPVVLSASRLAQPLSEAPNAMTVIDRQMIKASGSRSITDLFKLVPGMYVSYFTGNLPIVSYHGTTDDAARRMQVLVDGRAIHMPPASAVMWVDLPLQIQDIERIEVIRGPAAASYGDNSTQGVINIITRDASSQNGFSASATQGNGGINDGYAAYGASSDLLDYRISMGYHSDDGYDPNSKLTTTGNDTLNNDSHFTRLFNLRANYHPTARDSFDFQLGYTSGRRGDGSNKSGDVNFPHDQFHHENFNQIDWLHSLDGGSEIKLAYYHIYQDVLNSLEPSVQLSDNYINTRDSIELQHTLQTSAGNRLVWGASARHDWTNAPSRFLSQQTADLSTFFAHDEWRITNAWILNVGALQEYTSLGQGSLSPRAAIIYKLTDKQTLRAGVSRAWRNPSLYEENGNYHFPAPINQTIYQATGGLRPESVVSHEIGYLGEFPNIGTSIDVRLYYDQLSDIIFEYHASGQPITVFNMFDAEQQGLEITSKHQWGDRNTLTFNYSYQLAKSDYINSYTASSSAGYDGTAFNDGIPRNLISALYSKTFQQDWQLGMGYYQQDSMLTVDRSWYDRQGFTRRWDMRFAKGFRMGKDGSNAELAMVIQGVTDEHYVDYLVENQFNQRVFFTASYRY